MLPPEVQYEPVEALDGGCGGMKKIERLIDSVMTYLRPGGQLWLEIGSQQNEAIQSTLKKNGFGEIKAYRDYNNFPRFVSTKK